jgi:hypothetical protein
MFKIGDALLAHHAAMAILQAMSDIKPCHSVAISAASLRG